MPLLAPPVVIGGSSGTGTGGGGTGTGGGPVVVAPSSFVPVPSDRATLTWTSPNGSTWNLTDLTDRLFTPGGIIGLGAAPRSVIADLLPSGGSLVRSILPQPKTLTVPIYIGDDSQSAFITRWRLLIESFTCTDQLGPGELKVTRADGTARQISCYYSDGLEGDADDGLPAQVLALQLYAPDPFWTSGTSGTTLSFPYQQPRNYLSPYLTVGSSQALGATTITISGSQPAYPLWEFTGPFGAVTCSRGSDSFTITRSAAAGEVYTVNTAPGSTAAFSSDGTNLMGSVNFPLASFWQLNPGENDITLALTNASNGAGVVMTYIPRSETS